MTQRKRGRPRGDEPLETVLARILSLQKWHSVEDLCTDLGMTYSGLRKQFQRNGRLSRETLERIAWRTKCRIEYLESGEEPIYAEDPPISSLSTPLQDTLALIKTLSAERQEMLLGCARILAAAPDDHFRNMLTNLVLAVEQHVLPGKRLLREHHRQHQSGSTSESSTNE